MKKSLYTLGALTATITPVVAVVSCGTTNQTIKKTSDDTSLKLQGQEFVDHPNSLTGAKNLYQVGQYLNQYLTLKPVAEMKMDRYGLQAMTRFGDAELAEYNLDDGWINEFNALNEKFKWSTRNDWTDEYRGSTGFQRFNGDFEIFENVRPAIKSDFDYTNGGDLQIQFIIKDFNSPESLAYWSFLDAADGKNSVPVSIEQLKAMKNFSVSPAADPVKAKMTIQHISNAFNLIDDKKQLSILKQYFDKSIWETFSTVLKTDKVQKWISNNIDSIYDKWVKYPATDAKSLDAMESIMAHPDVVGVMTYLLNDFSGEKLNIINGVCLLKYIVDEAIKKGEIIL